MTLSPHWLSQDSRGIHIALLIILVWTFSIGFAFTVGTGQLGFWGCLLIIPGFTFLYTGLFVTGHDAMHGSVAPEHPALNRALGTVALLLYGLIPYDKLYTSHDHHHRYPASHRDPDFHNGRDRHPVLWYFRFMASYWTWRQTIGIVVIYNSLHRLIGVPESNLLIFWAVPSLLSSMQLFYFGTYRVHRQEAHTYDTPLCANSNYWPVLVSLLTCYHFGYHLEHHAYPEVPWWQLPDVVRRRRVFPNRAWALAPQPMTSSQYPLTNAGRPIKTMSKPFVQRDRTRLNT